MDTIEISARNSHDAIEQALRQLGLSADQAEITILSEGSKGILGIGAEDAKVRVSRRAAPAPAPAPVAARVAAPRSPRSRKPAEPVEAPASAATLPPMDQAEPAYERRTPTLTTGEVAQVAKQVVGELLQAMDIPGHVNVRNVASRADQPLDGDNPIVLDINGDDLGILIGRRGETLSALQLITNLIVGRRTKEWARIVVDVEGYRLRREEALRNLAVRMAERVRYSKTPFTMEAMPAHERRIIHLALKENAYVSTESHGEGEDRKVTVSPRR